MSKKKSMSKKMSEATEDKDFEEFRNNELSVGEILDASICVVSDMVRECVLSPIDMLKIPAVITRVLEKAVEDKEKENEDGTEED